MARSPPDPLADSTGRQRRPRRPASSAITSRWHTRRRSTIRRRRRRADIAPVAAENLLYSRGMAARWSVIVGALLSAAIATAAPASAGTGGPPDGPLNLG